ncbi:hypothetical protein ACWJJH_21475 [Endozoicomonadaceae bacterium StTr2]
MLVKNYRSDFFLLLLLSVFMLAAKAYGYPKEVKLCLVEKKYIAISHNQTDDNILQSLEDIGSCSVCLKNYFKNGKLRFNVCVTCNGDHHICKNCFERLPVQSGGYVFCPTCQQPIKIRLESEEYNESSFETYTETSKLLNLLRHSHKSLTNSNLKCTECWEEVSIRAAISGAHQCSSPEVSTPPVTGLPKSSASNLKSKISDRFGELSISGESSSSSSSCHQKKPMMTGAEGGFGGSLTYAQIIEEDISSTKNGGFSLPKAQRELEDWLQSQLDQKLNIGKVKWPLNQRTARYSCLLGGEPAELLLTPLISDDEYQRASESVRIRQNLRELREVQTYYGHPYYPVMLFDRVLTPPDGSVNLHVSVYPAKPQGSSQHSKKTSYQRLAEWESTWDGTPQDFWKNLYRLFIVAQYFHPDGYCFDGLTEDDLGVDQAGNFVILAQRLTKYALPEDARITCSGVWPALHSLDIDFIDSSLRHKDVDVDPFRKDLQGILLAVIRAGSSKFRDELRHRKITIGFLSQYRQLLSCENQGGLQRLAAELLQQGSYPCELDAVVMIEQLLLLLRHGEHPGHMLAVMAENIASSQFTKYLPDETSKIPVSINLPDLWGERLKGRLVNTQCRMADYYKSGDFKTALQSKRRYILGLHCDYMGRNCKFYTRSYEKNEQTGQFQTLIRGFGDHHHWVSTDGKKDICERCVTKELLAPCSCGHAMMLGKAAYEGGRGCFRCSHYTSGEKMYTCQQGFYCTQQYCERCVKEMLNQMPRRTCHAYRDGSHHYEPLEPVIVVAEAYKCDDCGVAFKLGQIRFQCSDCYVKRDPVKGEPNYGFDLCRECLIKHTGDLWKPKPVPQPQLSPTPTLSRDELLQSRMQESSRKSREHDRQLEQQRLQQEQLRREKAYREELRRQEEEQRQLLLWQQQEREREEMMRHQQHHYNPHPYGHGQYNYPPQYHSGTSGRRGGDGRTNSEMVSGGTPFTSFSSSQTNWRYRSYH